ncbi:hypothetical protein [Bacillus sp. S/N-304-OC-R1]|uniref:hypothetical protein n=1 Tax=Bacillus sp. S/N-304-OC-R1 TaxID=2758034 RepID=UPI001C8D2667|nr:hypothetical protein [Bacillus sp. S/N-304-OC-R1]MBY0124498.1 hypothetical protein [Bacillus sp. S/N-304-OC-R1]
MTPEQIRKYVEEYPDLLGKKEKLQKRLISLSGRDPDQEIVFMMRLQTIEQAIELIDSAAYEEKMVDSREACILVHRIEGRSIQEIADYFSLTHQGVRKIIGSAYKKMAESFNKEKIA